MGIDYKDLTVRFLTDIISKDEENFLLNWVTSDKRNEELFMVSCEAWIISGSKSGMVYFNPHSGWKKLQNKIQTPIQGQE